MQLLAEHTGVWSGTNRFRLMPDDQPAEAEASAQLSLGAGGKVAVLTYTWTHPDDGPQDGLLVLGPDETPGEVVALWGDSWHQTPAAKQLRGAPADHALTVGYSYAEGWSGGSRSRPTAPTCCAGGWTTWSRRPPQAPTRRSRTGRWTGSSVGAPEPWWPGPLSPGSSPGLEQLVAQASTSS